MTEEILSKAHDYAKNNIERTEEGGYDIIEEMRLVNAYLAGAKDNVPQWHYVKDELPKISDRYFVYTGGEPFILDFDTEAGSFGYWVASFGDDWGVRDIDFETVEDRGEDEVIAWQYLPRPPKETQNDLSNIS